MSKRSVRSSSRASTNRGGKGGKKQTLDPCSQCSKEEKNLKLLECSHGFCQDCVKTLVVKEPEEKEKDGRNSKLSTKGGKKSAPPKVEYVCSVCNPPEKEQDFTYGECAPCKFITSNIFLLLHSAQGKIALLIMESVGISPFSPLYINKIYSLHLNIKKNSFYYKTSILLTYPHIAKKKNK